jgi:hypothetical protein
MFFNQLIDGFSNKLALRDTPCQGDGFQLRFLTLGQINLGPNHDDSFDNVYI